MSDNTLPPRKRKHGLSYTPEYRIWKCMVDRCTNPNNQAWKDYGGRGITVCDEWLKSLQKFIEDMGRRPSDGHEIDRVDNQQGYCRSNCRWTSRVVNSRNRRSARIVEFRGEFMCLAEACEKAGMPYDVVNHRINGPAQWSVEKALLTPVRGKAARGKAVRRGKPLENATGRQGITLRKQGYVARCVVAGKRMQSKPFQTLDEAFTHYLKFKELNDIHKRKQRAAG